jgi:hypothetical protein
MKEMQVHNTSSLPTVDIHENGLSLCVLLKRNYGYPQAALKLLLNYIN